MLVQVPLFHTSRCSHLNVRSSTGLLHLKFMSLLCLHILLFSQIFVSTLFSTFLSFFAFSFSVPGFSQNRQLLMKGGFQPVGQTSSHPPIWTTCTPILLLLPSHISILFRGNLGKARKKTFLSWGGVANISHVFIVLIFLKEE